MTDPDPSLGVLGQNFMEIQNIGSVRFGSVGIPIRARRPKLHVWARNSRLRIARTILIADLESKQNLGSGRVLQDVFGYLCAQMEAPTRFCGSVGPKTGSEPVYEPTNTRTDPIVPYPTLNFA